MTEENISLNELILTVHNEVQRSVDYLLESALDKGNETDAKTIFMGIENIKVKLPLSLVLTNSLDNKYIENLNLKKDSIKKKELYIKVNVTIAETDCLGELAISFTPLANIN